MKPPKGISVRKFDQHAFYKITVGTEERQPTVEMMEVMREWLEESNINGILVTPDIKFSKLSVEKRKEMIKQIERGLL